MPAEEWNTAAHAQRYLERADEFPRRAEGEAVLLDHIPHEVRRVLDLGTGDGRLLAILQRERPSVAGVGLDSSALMLDTARKRFAGNDRVELVDHDMADPLPDLGRFDAVISSMAIHHLEHDRKRALYTEVFDVLEPGGVFANFEHVASPTPRLHVAFFAAIGEPLAHEDASDRLLDVETQLGYLRQAGFTDVDCYWKWLEMALLIGVKPRDRWGEGRRPEPGGGGAPAVIVRRLRPTDRDLAKIVEQINSASMEIDEPFTQARLAEFLVADRNVYLTAHIDGQLAGTLHAIAYTHPAGHRYLYVDEVDTDRAFRRQGVATAMMRATCEIAREMAVRAMWLGADEGNDAAHALYRSLGAQEIEPGVIYTYEIDTAHGSDDGA